MQGPWRPTLRLLIIALVSLPVVAVSGLLIVLLMATSTRVAEQLGRQLGDSAIDRVRTQTRDFLSNAVAVSDLYVHRLAVAGTLDPDDLDRWLPVLLDDLKAHSAVASICFARPDGATVWLLRNAGRLEFGRAASGETDATREWIVDPDNGTRTPLRTYTYVATDRPWFTLAVASNEPKWTPIYFWFPDQTGAAVTGTGYTRKVVGPGGELLGVLVIDVTLASLSDFLQRLPLAREGALFLTDDLGLLVAASDGPTNADASTRLSLTNSPSPAAAALAPFERTPPTTTARTLADGKPARVLTADLAPYPGIAWRLLVAVPESAFMAEAWAARRTGLIAATVTALLLVLLALLLSRTLSKPLLDLTSHIRRIGTGDLDARIRLDGARELIELSDELNAMSAGLKERTQMKQAMELAMQVQQSLLPRTMPRKGPLDIHGMSRYCDATGGDYFDFVESLDLGGEGTLIAIGDVMGHGVAASLLMATARAALRASVGSGATLGQVMTRINRVLAQDTTDVRFVTMTLLHIDPVRRRACWACAAHDPVIVFDPATGAFTELSDGDLPLGAVESTEYLEYSVDDLPPSGVLLLGTDGIWEARNAADEFFGKERLLDLVRQNASGTARQIATAIDAAHRAFTGDAPITDDITLVVIKLPA